MRTFGVLLIQMSIYPFYLSNDIPGLMLVTFRNLLTFEGPVSKCKGDAICLCKIDDVHLM